MKAHLFAAIGSSTKSSFVYVEACQYSMYYYLYVYKKNRWIDLMQYFSDFEQKLLSTYIDWSVIHSENQAMHVIF